MGPVLYFRGCRDGAWALSALTVEAAGSPPATLTIGAGRVQPQLLAERCGKKVWRYDFSVPLEREASRCAYAIGGQSWDLRLPGLKGGLRLAFTACNGSEQGETWPRAEERNRLWTELAAEHGRNPFHLLVQGGDQLYADPIWEKVPALADWRRMPWRRRRRTEVSPGLAAAIGDFYFDAYCKLWSQPELARVLSQIPSLMMWDDHDIIDGWGSYPRKWQECAVFQAIWSAAREHFALFQLGARPDDLPDGFSDRRGGHFGWAYRIGDIGILAPDLRSQRTRERVMAEAQWRALNAALESMADCRHVLLVSTVPLVNAHFGALERFFRWLPGHQSWQDDIIDQWPSLAHWEEWSRLLRQLVGFSSRTATRVTALSGEIHLGAFGVVESPAATIFQLTSSGIVHPPPPGNVVAALEWISSRDLRVEPDLRARLLCIPGLAGRFLRSRNWLEVELAPENSLVAAWHREEGPTLKAAIGGPSARQAGDSVGTTAPRRAEPVSGAAALPPRSPPGRR